ncbi:MAG: glycerophosphodiester phosphodiesterase [Anaerolineae bacterium]|nr:glycerophosphodiester phosphodiesterase [Anaerolineae bacterium]
MPSLWLTSDRPLNIAHRGASAVAPPNTLAAFRRAADLGADGVELDVHLSADGVPVVIHDFTVDATTDGSGRVRDLPLAALKALDAGSRFDPAFAGERIPTLEEVFAEVGGRLLVNVELKSMPGNDYPGLEAAVAALIRRHGLTNRVLVSSFNPFALRRFRREMPEVPIGFLYETAPLSCAARLAAALVGLRPQAVHPWWRMITPQTVRWAHARGRRIVAWTVDDPAAIARLAAWGVDAIITNHPDRMYRTLEPRSDPPKGGIIE